MPTNVPLYKHHDACGDCMYIGRLGHDIDIWACFMDDPIQVTYRYSDAEKDVAHALVSIRHLKSIKDMSDDDHRTYFLRSSDRRERLILELVRFTFDVSSRNLMRCVWTNDHADIGYAINDYEACASDRENDA